MDFNVEPLIGAGQLRFGMSQDEIRRQMASPYKSFLKSLSSKMPTDSFLEDAVHVFYTDGGNCEAIEFYAPSRVMLKSRNLLGVPYSEVKYLVSELDENLDEDSAGFSSHLLGVAVYAPSCEEYPDDPTESVLVFKKGYYDG